MLVAEIPAGKRLLDDLERGFDLVGQRHRIGAGLLLNRKDDGRLAAVSGVAALDPRGEIDIGDLAQQHRLVLPIRDRRCRAGRRGVWSRRHCG